MTDTKTMTGKVEKSDSDWRKQLTPMQYAVLREKATERPFSGEYEHEKTPGTYTCAGCGQCRDEKRHGQPPGRPEGPRSGVSGDHIGRLLPRTARLVAPVPHPRHQPSSVRRSSSMPKWWPTSWMTVRRTCSTTAASVVHIAQMARR